ncbi:sodium:proton antiporter NhaD [Candidatus Saccharibacteria bacterium]|nr:sodium:proton antiporter NhaD [Candidatus Saccharibacteria bacterium]
MDIFGFCAAGVFLAGYTLITLEQRLGTHKSAIALCMGTVLWIIAAVQLHSKNSEQLEAAVHNTGAELFGIVAFLLGAMALIEILVHYRLFDLIRSKLIKLKVGDKQQFILIMVLTFSFSAILDNIAITIVMLQIARRFFEGKNLLVAGAGIVIAANAGGAWSPIGDVTTVLLWLADKFTATEVIRYAFLPAFAIFLTALGLLYRQLDNASFMKREEGDVVKLSLSERLIISTALLSFLLPLGMNTIGLPPYFGLLFGLGLTWLMIEGAKTKSRHDHQTHMTANIEKLMQAIDISSIKFIIGILLSVSALGTIGVLAFLSDIAVGQSPSDLHLIYVNIAIGLMSSILDNSSLVAMAITVLPMTDPELWALTALAAGTGGSIFIIASAAGVVAMGSLKQLDFGTYFRIGTLPALAGFAVGMGVWAAQYYLL